MNLEDRLLHIIKPLEYDILLKPDMQAFTFTGEETITFSLEKPTQDILLHAKNVEVTKAVLLEGEKQIEAEISYKEKEMAVVLHFSKGIEKGQHKVQLVFKGVIGEKLKGWYKSAYSVNGETRHLATTQFEEIGAREVFPSIDDPLAKAIFTISLMIPSHLTAISNTVDTHTVEHENGYKTVTFSPTPKMATYALAFIVGEFEYLEDTTTSGIRVRVYVTPGKKSQAQFALSTTVKMLPFYEEYFDIKYPLPVMDLIAIPDFDAGAMENWGAITAREVAILVDSEQTSAANKQWVATVIAHELTHMWFGNLVTMKWWEDLWLNEGFASYMEYAGMDKFFPEWKVWEQFAVLDHNRAMGLDSLENTHPIQSKITSVEKISENFDEVSYSKGASIIQMVATYLGEKDFREGLRHYLKKHSYGNAETEDLWIALEKVSGKQVTHIMRTFTQKPGYPILSVKSFGEKLHITQERFFSNAISRKQSKDTTVWSVPLKSSMDGKEETLLLDKKSTEFAKTPSWIKLNVGETSFARTVYDEALYSVLKQPIEGKLLPSVDRMGIIRDAFDSAESGYSSVVKALELAKSYKNETSYIVWASLAGKLGKVENILDTENSEKQFASYACSIFSEVGKRVGWEKKAGDLHEDILLRSTILSSLGMYKDKETIAKAKELFEKAVKDKSTVDTDVRGIVYVITAENSGEKEFEILKNLYIKEELSSEKNRIGNAMCLFEDPNIIKKALDFSLSEHVRTQDIGRFLVISFGNKKGWQVTWQFVKDHWDELLERMEGIEMDWIIDGAASIVDETLAKDIFAFFTSHPYPKLDKAMRQVKEQIESNLDWAKRDREAIEKYLDKQ